MMSMLARIVEWLIWLAVEEDLWKEVEGEAEVLHEETNKRMSACVCYLMMQ